MSSEEKSDPNITAESGWELHHRSSDEVDHGYFFGDDYRESSVLSEFGWNIPAEFQRIESDWAARGAGGYFSADSSATVGDRDVTRRSIEPVVVGEKVEAASPSNPSISSSSSEDAPEKSAASGATSAAAAAAANPPSDTASCKTKKKGPKQIIRQQRFAFVTKSEVDHLEDGYRWRKYGQKAVKNSPFPRSYYRCTNSKCMVKKRIERSSEDPSVVITTYEGQHCHLSAGYPRGGGGGGGLVPQESVYQGYMNPSNSQIYHPRFSHPSQDHSLSVGALPPHVQAGGGRAPRTAAVEVTSQTPVGEGLLGDIVPPRMPWI